jgi:hypothetical protein
MITSLMQAASLEETAQVHAAPFAPKQQVLLIGARGRLGEILLNDLLAQSHYSKVYVLAEHRLEMGISKLETCTWNEALDIDHVVINDTPLDPESPGAFHGRDQVYHCLGEQEWPTMLQWLQQLKPRAAALISPLAEFYQFSNSANGSLSPHEFALVSQGVSSCTILRPLAKHALPANASRMERFMALWFGQFRWIFAHPSQSLLSKDVSAATMAHLKLAQAGMRVVSAQDMLPNKKASR